MLIKAVIINSDINNLVLILENNLLVEVDNLYCWQIPKTNWPFLGEKINLFYLQIMTNFTVPMSSHHLHPALYQTNPYNMCW